MLGAPIDAWYVLLAVSLASVAVTGLALSLPTGTTPPATDVAETVDEVAASPPPTVGKHPIDADQVLIGPHRITVVDDGDRADATYRFGPITPASPGSKLERVLHGEPPEHAFSSPSEFQSASEAAREREPRWQPVQGSVTVRSVSWGETDVTLVGA